MYNHADFKIDTPTGFSSKLVLGLITVTRAI